LTGERALWSVVTVPAITCREKGVEKLLHNQLVYPSLFEKVIKKMKKTLNGFTLIELLIVVAIIAILAAIAVPNFLEAQTRAKVSRVKADMRSVATAIESYRVDYNRMFPTYRVSADITRKWIFGYMTTPIAYMTSAPADPFNLKDPIPDDRMVAIWGPDWIDGTDGNTVNYRDNMGSYTINATGRGVFFSPWPGYTDDPGAASPNMTKENFWVMMSWGPDQIFAVTDPWPAPITPYDPTNGTISKGDVTRFAD
jgi:general secretion pathway protein G